MAKLEWYSIRIVRHLDSVFKVAFGKRADAIQVDKIVYWSDFGSKKVRNVYGLFFLSFQSVYGVSM